MKLHRKLSWVSLYKNTTRGHDWLTTTTMKWPTSCFALKKHLFWNCQARFTETLQEASLDDLLQKINKGSWLIKTTTATTTATTTKWLTSFFALKKHLRNYQSKFKETLQEASSGDPLQKYNKGSWLINNNNNNEMADFLFCFKKHLLWNYQSKFNETLQEFSLGDLLL